MARHLAPTRRWVVGGRVLGREDVARAHPERQARRDGAVERGDPVVTLLERPGDPDLSALVALSADDEGDPARAIEDPHPLVERACQLDVAEHLDQVRIFEPDACRETRRARLRHGHRAAQKLIERPSTAIAASPMTSDRVGWACVAPPISHAVASSSNASDASAIRSVACGPTIWTPSVSWFSGLLMTLAKPSYSPPMSALAMAWNGTLPTL